MNTRPLPPTPGKGSGPTTVCSQAPITDSDMHFHLTKSVTLHPQGECPITQVFYPSFCASIPGRDESQDDWKQADSSIKAKEMILNWLKKEKQLMQRAETFQKTKLEKGIMKQQAISAYKTYAVILSAFCKLFCF